MIFIAMQECLAAVLFQPIGSGVGVIRQARDQSFAVGHHDDLACPCRRGEKPGKRIQQGRVQAGFRLVEDEDSGLLGASSAAHSMT